MTIAIGLFCFDGWIIAADSQETVGDYSKTSTDKIRLIDVNKDWRIVFTAAGDSSYADMLQWKIERTCSKIKTFNFSVAENTISAEVLNLHKEHVWPRPYDKPSLEVLILIHKKKNAGHVRSSGRLLAVSDTAVFPVDYYRAIGIGAYMADYLYDLCCRWAYQTAEAAERGIIYMLKEIKKSINGCGGESDIAFFPTDGTFYFSRKKEVDEIEAALTELDKVFKTIFAVCSGPDNEGFNEELETCKSTILRAREKQLAVFTARAKKMREIRGSRNNPKTKKTNG